MQFTEEKMLTAALARLRHPEVRAIITALGLGRRATQNQKETWVAAIAAIWLDPAQQPALLARLSPAALGALWRLFEAGELPRLLFLGEYGALRLPGDGGASTDRAAAPWRQAQTVSEELFYAGLLLPTAAQTMATTSFVQAPTALRTALQPLLAARLGGTAQPPRPRQPLPSQPPPLLHDLAQWLIYLHQPDAPLLQQGRWLPPRHFAAFHARLLQPKPRTPLSTHKQTPWPALLSFLAAAAHLVHAGQVTAAGWQWLAADPAQQLRTLWAAWWQAEQALRLAYHQPVAQLPAPWPHLVLPALTATFTAAGLTNHLLVQERAWHGYFLAHLSDLQTLDAAHADLLTVLQEAFGAIAPADGVVETAAGGGVTVAPAPPHAIPYQLTPLGCWLLALPRARSPLAHWQRRRPMPPTLDVVPMPDGGVRLHITLPVQTPPLALAQLAPFAQVDAATDAASAVAATGVHTYGLDERSVGQAAAAHYDLPTLFGALTTVGLLLPAAYQARLHAWYAAGRRLQVTLLPLVRTTDAALMVRLQQNRRLHPWLGEVLNPTTAVWHGPLAAFLATLRRQGFYPDVTTLEQAVAAADGAHGAGADATPDAGLLWLATHTYQLLGRFLPLPVALPTAHLRTLAQALTPVEQAALTAHLAQVEAHLVQLLDHLPLTPPPTPTDPEQWRPLLEAAIAAQSTLQMRYFSAGRNLTTQRLIDPYWLEVQHGVRYLRAYCHSAGTVLTFRLDRIEALAVADPTAGYTI